MILYDKKLSNLEKLNKDINNITTNHQTYVYKVYGKIRIQASIELDYTGLKKIFKFLLKNHKLKYKNETIEKLIDISYDTTYIKLNQKLSKYPKFCANLIRAISLKQEGLIKNV